MSNEPCIPAFDVEVATVEEFLRLLEQREEGEAISQSSRGEIRKAVFIVGSLDRRDSGYGWPMVRRYVVVAFTYGQDSVFYYRTSSNAVEPPEAAAMAEDRLRAAYREVREEIERGLEELDLEVPVYEGFLRRPADPGEET